MSKSQDFSEDLFKETTFSHSIFLVEVVEKTFGLFFTFSKFFSLESPSINISEIPYKCKNEFSFPEDKKLSDLEEGYSFAKIYNLSIDLVIATYNLFKLSIKLKFFSSRYSFENSESSNFLLPLISVEFNLLFVCLEAFTQISEYFLPPSQLKGIITTLKASPFDL